MNSGLGVCCTPHVLPAENDGKLIEKSGRTQSTAKTSDNSSEGSPLPVREGFSFSSISSKSSSDCKQTEESTYPPPEMRNDSEWCQSMSDELRVAESSYDEATTEAVNVYYGDPRQAARHNTGGRDGIQQRREA